MPAEYKEIKFSEPTAIHRYFENNHNCNSFPTLTSLSNDLPLFTSGNINESLAKFSKPTYTNLQLDPVSDIKLAYDTINLDEDFLDFSIKPNYTGEVKLKVKKFIIETSIRLNF